MTIIGYGALWLVLFIACYVLFVVLFRHDSPLVQRSARNAMLCNAALITISAGALFYLLLTRDFSVQYVYSQVNRAQPLLYTISAFWAGQEGSLLFWAWSLAVASAVLAMAKVGVSESTRAAILAVLALQQAFAVILLLFQSNPFVMLEQVPLDGLGMNPLLQNVWMIIHPPVVFVAYALYGVAFAVVIGALVTRGLDRALWRMLERWNLLAWLFLGAGILLGSWWAYLELGWGGYWGWDPVENASLVPWLVGTALLHANVVRRQRRSQEGWVMGLTATAYLLCLLAAFITRSGLIQSVHAFERSSIGYLFLGFIGILLVATVALMTWRRDLFTRPGHAAESSGRDLTFALTELLLCGLAGIILAGTLFPTLSELVRGVSVALNARFYGQTTAPLFAVLLAILSVCPLLRWQGGWDGDRRHVMLAGIAGLITVIVLYVLGIREVLALVLYGLVALVLLALGLRLWHDSEHLRKVGEALRRYRRRYGAHLAHLGLALLTIGIASSSLYAQEDFLQLEPGGHVPAFGYELTLRQGIEEAEQTSLRQAAIIELAKGGHVMTYLVPERRFYDRMQQWVSEVAIHTTLSGDLYLALAGLEGESASIHVLYNPLVVWIWIGGVLLLIGTAVVLGTTRSSAEERAA